MFFTVTQLVAAALLPPLSLLLVLLAAGFVRRRAPRCAMLLAALATAGLWLLSTPWIAGALLKSLEIAGPVAPDALRHADAIVVLGGGRRLAAAEYGGDTLNALSLERLRYAARLHRQSGVPLLLTGGRPGQRGTLSEAAIMRDILRDEYGLAARWIEPAAETTWDNARNSARLLHNDNVHTLVLVSHAWHLRRAVSRFEAAGFAVIPAGVQFADTRLDSVFSLLPSAAALRDSSFALHEWLGILWYKLRSVF